MATIVRVDKYNITVNGVRVRATPDQEAALRGMDDAGIDRFITIMGKR